MAGGCRAFGLRGGAVALVGAFELELEGGAFGVAGFGDDHFGESGPCVFVVAVGAVQQQDGVGVLFEGPESRRSESWGRLSGRRSDSRESWAMASTGMWSSLASILSERLISDTSS